MQTSVILFLLLAYLALVSGQLTVTLSHGGQLQGRKLTWKGKSVDVFLGVRYAKAPVGPYRFKRPVPEESWTGVQNAVKFGHVCTQSDWFNKENPENRVGSEDCLFLDVWLPTGTKSSDKKAVMVWIHGGGYQAGNGQQIMHPVTHGGDVIVVSVGYRLGTFGFLTDGSKGSGNFGLWDQRQALIWVQKNIAAFGGDSSRVTIFGESAGAGSVSCQAMSPLNDGLFQRVIQQSGACLASWSFGVTPRERQAASINMKKAFNCTAASIYDCLEGHNDQSINQVLNNNQGMLNAMDLMSTLSPFSDGEFFREDAPNGDYKGIERYDLMVGYNGQEGCLLTPYIQMMAHAGTNNTLEEHGVSIDGARIFIGSPFICGRIAATSICSEYLIKLYGIDDKDIDDKERLYRLTIIIGDIMFGQESKATLDSHVKQASGKNLYGYHMTELFKPKPGTALWPVPDWLKRSADHVDELYFVFNCAAALTDYPALFKELYDGGRPEAVLEERLMEGCEESLLPLSSKMVSIWTNFAKTGNPNKPIKVEKLPPWPKYSADSDKVMTLNTQFAIKTTPDKELMSSLEPFRVAYLKSHQTNAPVEETKGVQLFGQNVNTEMASLIIYMLLIVCCIMLLMVSQASPPKPVTVKTKSS